MWIITLLAETRNRKCTYCLPLISRSAEFHIPICAILKIYHFNWKRQFGRMDGKINWKKKDKLLFVTYMLLFFK